MNSQDSSTSTSSAGERLTVSPEDGIGSSRLQESLNVLHDQKVVTKLDFGRQPFSVIWRFEQWLVVVLAASIYFRDRSGSLTPELRQAVTTRQCTTVKS